MNLKFNTRMKKFNLRRVGIRAGAILTLIFCAGIAFGQNVEHKDSMTTIPAEVKLLVKSACTTCHSNAGRDKPKAKVNFSVWDQYTPMEKTMLASSMTEVLKKGDMPPKRYLETHPEGALTEDQISQIVKWCDSLKAKP
jgi:cytochrome c553